MVSPTSLLLWSTAAYGGGGGSSSSQDMSIDIDDGSPGGQLPDLGPIPTKKPKKSDSKQPRRRPQRGPGVAQLERMRLQDQRGMRMSDAAEIQPFQIQTPPAYDAASLSAIARYGAWIEGPPPAAGICYLPRGASPAGLIGFGAGSPAAARSVVLHEQYSMDRYRVAMGEGRVLQNPSTYHEFPSSQMVMLQKLPDCDFCARKKLLSRSGENPGLSGSGGMHYGVQDLNALSTVDLGPSPQQQLRRAKSARMMEVTEYDFFPQAPTAAGDGGVSELVKPTPARGVAATDPHHVIDLSLSL